MSKQNKHYRINPKHYIGKAATSNFGIVAIFTSAAFGFSYVADEITDSNFDDTTNVKQVKQFEKRLSELKSMKSDISFSKDINKFSLEEQKFIKEAYKYLSDVVINEDDTKLSEKDRMVLLDKFDTNIADLSNFGFYKLGQEEAARLSNYRFVGNIDDFSDKVDAAIVMTKLAKIDEIKG